MKGIGFNWSYAQLEESNLLGFPKYARMCHMELLHDRRLQNAKIVPALLCNLANIPCAAAIYNKPEGYAVIKMKAESHVYAEKSGARAKRQKTAR